QRTRWGAPSLRRSGGFLASGVTDGSADGSAAADGAADASAFVAELGLGRRIRYIGTATSASAVTSATTICARSGRSGPPPTPRRRSEGSPELDGNGDRDDGGPGIRRQPVTPRAESARAAPARPCRPWPPDPA